MKTCIHFILTFLFFADGIIAQAIFGVACNQSTNQLEVILTKRKTTDHHIIKDGFPNQAAAESYLNANRSTLSCEQAIRLSTPAREAVIQSTPPSSTRQGTPPRSQASKIKGTDITGIWFNKKNDCVAGFSFTGSYWVATVHEDSTNPGLKIGEVIAELYPQNNDRLRGRIKIIKRNGNFKWKKVKYRASLTKLKQIHKMRIIDFDIMGDLDWSFWAP